MDSDLSRLIREASIDTQALLDQMALGQEDPPESTAPPIGVDPDQPTLALDDAGSRGQETEPHDAASVALGTIESEPTLDDRLRELADALANQAEGTDATAKVLINIIAALHPEIVPPEVGEQIFSIDEPARSEAVRIVADLLQVLARDGEADLSAAINAAAERLGELEELKIVRAQVCSSVEGFGRYTPIDPPSLLAGRGHWLAVYVEVDHFKHRPVQGEDFGSSGNTSGDVWAVDLSQELLLYNNAGDLLAWTKPETRVVETSRNRRRDFFIVHDVHLPPTLTVGSYRLKIVMRDRTSGAVAETIVPIHVVADAKLATLR